MKSKILFIFCFGLILFGCGNLDSIKPSGSNAFSFFYGGTGNYRASSVLPLDDGYLLAGDSVGAEGYGILIIRTNLNGKTIWRKMIPGGTVSSLIATPSGYLICGDSVKVDLTRLSIIDQTRTKMRLISIDGSGTILNDKSFGDITVDNQSRKDQQGNAVTIDNLQNIIVTSTISLPNASPEVNSFTQVSSHNLSTLNEVWKRAYNQDENRNYRNGKSVLINSSGNIIWSASSTRGTPTNGVSFLRIPVLVPNSAPLNGDTYGQNDPTNFYSGNDIKANVIGFGIIGTFQSSVATNSNVFFIRTDPAGNIINNSELFFDGSVNNPLTDKTSSLVQDQGITLTTTSDGGFLLAGTTTTTPDGTWGNGGKDIYLIRLDAAGQLLWNKFLGGSGDETPNNVVQTADGGFIIAGTNILAGQSSMFLLKTNALAELKN